MSEAARQLQALPKDAPEPARRALYVQTRWLVRGLVFSNPAFDFDRLLFVKRFTQETYPDVCLNHMPWVSRPGGDLCVLSGAGGRTLASVLAAPPAGAAASLRYLLNRALGPGHVHRPGPLVGWDPHRVRLCPSPGRGTAGGLAGPRSQL